MGEVIAFGTTPVPPLADRLALLCRQHLLERPDHPVPIAHLVWELGSDTTLIQAALDRLRRTGRVQLARFPQRHRPHAMVEAVVRIDDLTLRPPPS
ncbi:MAG: hypothetical protein RLY86_2053 [Pseudomonadota bacterium]|jgi:hypothetical protein